MYKEIFNMTFSSIFENTISLIKALFIYTIIMIVISYISMDNIVVNANGEVKNKSTFIFFITFLLSYLVTLMIVISTHRILILGEGSIPEWGLFKFTQREWTFIGKGIVMGLIVALIFIPGMLLSIPFGGGVGSAVVIGILLIIAAILVSRFSLVFPAISVDKDITLMDAWGFTKEYKLLVFFTVVIFPGIFSLIFGFIYGMAIGFLSRLFDFNLFFLDSILNIVIAVFTISALSATYRLISEEHPEFFEEQEYKEVPLRDTIVESQDNNHKIIIHDKNDIAFVELIDKIKLQYLKLGFTNIVVDSDSSWMVKNPQNEESYILLSHIDDEYIIEIYQAEMIDFINQLI